MIQFSSILTVIDINLQIIVYRLIITEVYLLKILDGPRYCYLLTNKYNKQSISTNNDLWVTPAWDIWYGNWSEGKITHRFKFKY